eukprot:scaffold2010_cov301-Prasinococcus_capsulatus_cf.AAC.16
MRWRELPPRARRGRACAPLNGCSPRTERQGPPAHVHALPPARAARGRQRQGRRRGGGGARARARARARAAGGARHKQLLLPRPGGLPPRRAFLLPRRRRRAHPRGTPGARLRRGVQAQARRARARRQQQQQQQQQQRRR